MARKSRKQDIQADNTTPRIARVGAYIRQSSDGRRKPGDTLETQRDIIENFVNSTPDMELIEVYIDNNKSGTSFDRPAFQRMLEDIESGHVNCVICKDLTRFGRNAIDSGYYLEQYLPKHGVRFIAITDNYDILTGDGGLLIPLKNIIAETYALDIGHKVRAVHQLNIQDGRFVGRLAPYGYAKSAEDCHKLVVDETAAAVVRQIYDWSSRRWLDGEIVRELNETGVLVPTQYKQSHGLRVGAAHDKTQYWTRRTVAGILTDTVYVGDMVQGRTRKVNGKQLDIPREEWITVPNTHEALVSRELFAHVQRLRAENSQQDKESRCASRPYTPNLFAGKVFCAHCGYPMHRNKQAKHEYYWFRCESQWKYGQHTCLPVSVKETDLLRELMAMLRKQAEVVLGGYVQLEQRKPTEITAFERELAEINCTLGKSGWMLSSLYENMLSELISQGEFVQLKAEYKAEIERLSRRADEIRQGKRDLAHEFTTQYTYADALSDALANDLLSAGIIDALVEKILVNPDKSFAVQFRLRDEFQEVRHVG